MRLSDIIRLLREYIIIGIVSIIIIGVLFLIGYKLIYQKIMKGTKKINKNKLILYGITIIYGAIVVRSSIFK